MYLAFIVGGIVFGCFSFRRGTSSDELTSAGHRLPGRRGGWLIFVSYVSAITLAPVSGLASLRLHEPPVAVAGTAAIFANGWFQSSLIKKQTVWREKCQDIIFFTYLCGKI